MSIGWVGERVGGGLREVGALPAYASGEGSGVEVTKD